RVANAWRASDAGEDGGRVSHLRHPLRTDERRHLDDGKASGRQVVDERDLVDGRDLRVLVLQAIARSDLDDGDFASANVHDVGLLAASGDGSDSRKTWPFQNAHRTPDWSATYTIS